MDTQKLIHWLEEGIGGRIVFYAAVISFIIFFSVLMGYKQYRGPNDENTYLDAVIARTISEGEGFRSLVNYPQVAAFYSEDAEHQFAEDQLFPEIYRPPLYPLVLAGALAVLPESVKADFWSEPEVIGFHPADFFLLVVNIFFFWLSCGLTWYLAYRIFSQRVAWVALGGVFLSFALWQQVLFVTGTSLLMALVLLLSCNVFGVSKLVEGKESELNAKGLIIRSVLIGIFSGLIFLTEYSAGLIGITAIAFIALRVPGKFRWLCSVVALLSALAVMAPWVVRNVQVSGSPIGLSWQQFFLKKEDPTAEPTLVRKAWDTEIPSVSFFKVIHKGLEGLEANFSEKIWKGGSYFFVGFCIAGAFYQFRKKSVNSVRWWALGMVLLLFIAQPIFNSGTSLRQPSSYLVPLIVILGSGFLFMLIDSFLKLSDIWKYVVLAGLLSLHALPILNGVLEPAPSIRFKMPYYPKVMYLMKSGLKEQFFEGFGLMSDLPAGTAWYANTRVWAQPSDYPDFVRVVEEEAIGGLLLTSKLLDRPYFSYLLQQSDKSDGNDSRGNVGWSSVYSGLLSRQIPDFFPLQNVMRITNNTYILTDRRAHKQRQR